VKIRLAEIDCPEWSQPWGNKAKQALSNYTFQKVVTINLVTQDCYGRTVTNIFANEENVNKTTVRDSEFFDLENEARENKRGL
jgi:endonuclease YncB( thermonuclease family)